MSKKDFKLHQLLATVGTRDAQATKLIREAAHTFDGKDSHFNGRLKTYHPDDDTQDSIADEKEQVQIVSTVQDKLNFIQKAIINSVDTVIAKEETNSSGQARASLKIGNNEVTLSATALLALEKRMIQLRSVYNLIPTLDPTKVWNYDEDRGYFKTLPTLRNRLVKKIIPVVVVQATKEFPAQVKETSTDVKVGHYEEIHYSAKIPVSMKAKILDRIDGLIDAISLARAKANQCDVVENPIMEDIFTYINNPN